MAFCILSELIRHSFSEWSIPHDMIFSPRRSKSCSSTTNKSENVSPQEALEVRLLT